MRWEGANAVVTGASRGIGRAVVQAAVDRGARVGLVSRSQSDLHAVLAEMGDRGAAAAADIADRHQVDAAIAALEEAMGPIDILVANAGIGMYGPFLDADIDEIERTVQVNLLGTIYPLKAVLPGMVARGRGHIVVVSSVAGRFGSPFEGVYAATKFGQIGLAEALSVEVAGSGVGVSIVNPGVVDTTFFETRGHAYDRPFPKPIAPQRIARAVIRAVETGRLESYEPRWFRPAVVVRHLVPGLYARGTRRSFKAELGG